MTDIYAFRFYRLYHKYLREHGHMSFVVTDSLVYKELIAMGKIIVPLILEELNKEGSITLLTMLYDITMYDLEIPDDRMGDIEFMTQKALTWGKKEGYIK